MTTLTRATDADTSRLAAERIVRSGAREGHIALIVGVLRDADAPLTMPEIGALCGLSQEQVARRSGDMRDRGLWHVVNKRRCTIKPSVMQTFAYGPIPTGQQEIF